MAEAAGVSVQVPISTSLNPSFMSDPKSTLNFGNYYGGAATVQGQPPAVAAALSNPLLLLGLAFVAFLVFKKRLK